MVWGKLQGKELHANRHQVTALFDGPSLVAFSFQVPSAQQSDGNATAACLIWCQSRMLLRGLDTTAYRVLSRYGQKHLMQTQSPCTQVREGPILLVSPQACYRFQRSGVPALLTFMLYPTLEIS